MKKKKIFAITAALTLVTVLVPNIANASDENTLQPTGTYRTFSYPIGVPLTQFDLKKIADMNLTFKYAGAECKIKSVEGCTVTRSSNAMIPIGLVIKAVVNANSSVSYSTASYKMKCGWCSVTGDLLTISLFVIAAPASTPSAIVVATYAIGVGIILGHA